MSKANYYVKQICKANQLNALFYGVIMEINRVFAQYSIHNLTLLNKLSKKDRLEEIDFNIYKNITKAILKYSEVDSFAGEFLFRTYIFKEPAKWVFKELGNVNNFKLFCLQVFSDFYYFFIAIDQGKNISFQNGNFYYLI